MLLSTTENFPWIIFNHFETIQTHIVADCFKYFIRANVAESKSGASKNRHCNTNSPMEIK